MTAPRGRDARSSSSGVPPTARGAVIIGLAVIVGIIGLQVLDDAGTSDGAAPSTAAPTDTTSGSSGTTFPAARPQGEVRVKVYNASGVDGQAQATTDTLKSLGWITLPPGDYGSKRKGTAVQCRSGFENDAQVLAVYGVRRNATVEPYPANPPKNAGDADCLVIEGEAT